MLFLLLIFTVVMHTHSQNSGLDDADLHTIYLEDLCDELSKSKDALLLDVRSKGEYDDTSSYGHLNIGRLKNSVNIDIMDIENRLSEIKEYKNKDVFVYCSHSQRSRRVSRLLLDSGFTRVHNINGGLSDYVFNDIDCSGTNYTSSLPYRLYSPAKVKEHITRGDAFILDIRSAKEFTGIAKSEFANVGRLKGAVNIPAGELESRLGEIPKDRKIIIYDFDAGAAPKAASMLAKNGFTDVGMMVFGLYSYVYKFGSGDNFLQGAPKYPVLSYMQALNVIKKSTALLLDIRTADEFNNKSKEEHMNMGHLKGSVNIPADEFGTRMVELDGSKKKEILIYGSYKDSKAAEIALLLQANGFENVSIAASGYYKMIWNKKNLKGYDLPLEMIERP